MRCASVSARAVDAANDRPTLPPSEPRIDPDEVRRVAGERFGRAIQDVDGEHDARQPLARLPWETWHEARRLKEAKVNGAVGVTVGVTVGSTSAWPTRRNRRAMRPNLPMQLSAARSSSSTGAAKAPARTREGEL